MTRPLPLRPLGLARATATLVAAGSLLLTAALTAPAAEAASAVTPSGGAFKINGAGWGHEHGMSQWGAYAQARAGRSWQQIVAFYYPGTKATTRSGSTTIRVWITADRDSDLRVLPAAGLTLSDAHGHRLTLPTGSKYRSWRVKRSGAGYALSSIDGNGASTALRTGLDTSTWHFSTSSKVVKVRLPGSVTKEYRGTVALVKRGAGARTVNTLRLEDYVRSVVPSEMPTSWSRQAVQAQAVAARTFAARLAEVTSYPGYDVCDTTNCQVYGGRATIYGNGRRVVRETTAGDAAVKATQGVVLTYGGKAALTQFSSSNGGASDSGGLPYLVEQLDPWDGKLKSQTWSRTITASSVARAYGSVGTVRSITITKRSGTGRWGGHVYRVKITGSKKSITVSGGSFQGRFGLRSSLFTVTRP